MSNTNIRKNPSRLPALRLLTASVIVGLGAFPLGIYAQALTADPSQGGKLEVTRSANGVPLVNIVAPNAAGLSHNKFVDYNVGQQGLILNNSKDLVGQSRLGGTVIGNTNLANTPAARVILNEVTSQNRSTLAGYTEVHGAAADVVVANPNGISCNGCGFFNTPHATLTTGNPVMAASGALSGFQVHQGDVRIGADGLDARNVDVMDIITRTVALEGTTRGQLIRVHAGGQDVSYAAANETVTTQANGSSPSNAVAISSTAVGGMYGDRLLIVSSDKGAGVTMKGELAANVGELRLQADGNITFSRLVANQADVQVQTSGSVTADADLHNAAGAAVSNLAAGRNVQVQAGQIDINRSVAAGNLRFAGDTVVANAALSQGDMEMLGTNAVGVANAVAGGRLQIGANASTTTVGTALAAGPLAVTGARVAAGTLQSQNTLTVSTSSGDMLLGNASAAGNIALTSAGNIGYDSVATDGSLKVTANQGSVALLNAGSTGLLSAAQGVTLTAQGALQGKNIVSGTGVEIAADALSAGQITAATAVRATTAKGLTAAIVKGQQVTLRGGSLLLGNVDATAGAISATATQGDARMAQLSAADAITVDAKGALSVLRGVYGAGNVQLTGGSMDVAEAVAGIDYTQSMAQGHLTLGTDLRDVRLLANGKDAALSAGALTATANVLLEGDGNVSYASARSGQNTSISSHNGDTTMGSTRAMGHLLVDTAKTAHLGGNALGARSTDGKAQFDVDGAVVVAAKDVDLANSDYRFGGYYVTADNAIDVHNATLTAKADAARGILGNIVMRGANITTDAQTGLLADGMVSLAASQGGLQNLGRMQSGGVMELLTPGNIVNGGTINAGGALVIAALDSAGALTRSTSFTNQAGASASSARGNVAVRTKDFNSQGSLTASAGKVDIDAASVSATGDIASAQTLRIDADALINATGTVAAADVIALSSERFSSTAGASVRAGGDLYVGKLDSSGQLTRSTSVDNRGTLASSGASVFVNAADIKSQAITAAKAVDLRADSISASGAVTAATSAVHMLASKAITVTGNIQSAQEVAFLSDTFSNAASTIDSRGEVVIGKELTSTGLARNTSTLNGGTIRSNNHRVTVATGALSNTGTIDAGTADALLLTGSTNNAGKVLGGDVSVAVDTDYDGSGELLADKTLRVVAGQGSIRTTGTQGGNTALTGGEVLLQAAKDIVLTATNVDAKGNAAQGLAGNVLLSAGGNVEVAALQTSSPGASQRTEDVKKSDWVDGLIHVDRTETTTTTWNEVNYQIQASSVQASNDVALQAGGNIKVFASDLSSGNGQVYSGKAIDLLAGKQGVEKVDKTVHFVAKERGCVLVICADATKEDQTYNLANDSAPARVAQINGSVAALKSRVDVAVLQQQLALGTTTGTTVAANGAVQINGSQAQGPETVKAGTVALDGSITATAGNAPAVATVSVAPQADAAAVSAALQTPSANTAPAQAIPQETRSAYTDAATYTQSADFSNRAGYGSYAVTVAQYTNTQATPARDPVALAGTTTGSNPVGLPVATPVTLRLNGSTVASAAASPVSALTQNGNIVMRATNGILGEGTQIGTSGSVDMATSSGDIRFTAIEQSNSSVSFDSERKAGTFLGLGGTSVLTTKLSESTTWTTASIAGGSGVSMRADSGTIALQGAGIIAKDGDIDLGAKRIDITSVQDTAHVMTNTQTDGFLYGKTVHTDAQTEVSQGALLVAGKNLTVRGQDGISMQATGLASGADTSLYAGYDANGTLVNKGASVTLLAARDHSSASSSSNEAGLFVGSEDNWLSFAGTKSASAAMTGTQARGVSAAVGGNLTIQAGQDITGEAVKLASVGNTTMVAGNDVRLDAVAQEFTMNASSSSTSVGIGNFGFTPLRGDISIEMGVKGASATSDTKGVTHQGSTVVAGKDLSIQAGHDIEVIGSKLKAGNDMTLAAANNITIKNTLDTSETHGTQDTLFAGVRVGVSTPVSEAIGGIIFNAQNAATDLQTGDTGAFFGDTHRALNKAIDLGTAINDIAKATASPTTGADGKTTNPAAGLRLATINIEATLRTSHLATSQSAEAVQGSELAAGNNLSLQAGHDVNIQASQVKTGSKLAVDAGNDINLTEAYNSAKATSDKTAIDVGAGVHIGISGDLKASLADVYVRGVVSGDGSSAESRTAVGSTLQGGDVALHAGHDLNARAATVEGTTVALNAKNNINLESAQNTSLMTTGGGFAYATATVGIGENFMPNSLGIDAGGKVYGSNAQSATQVNTHITGSQSVSFASGADTNLKGAVIQGGSVTGNVGGNLNVESRQDTASSNKFSVRGDVSVGISASPSFSFDVELAGALADKKWVAEQSGIKAGGPANIKVGGNTNLVGGIINSSSGQTNLQTASLSFSNIQDYDWGAGGFFNLGFGISLPSGGAPTLKGLPEFGIGFDYRNKQQTTSATVGAGNVTVGGNAQVPAGLNRDAGQAQKVTTDDKFGFAFGF